MLQCTKKTAGVHPLLSALIYISILIIFKYVVTSRNFQFNPKVTLFISLLSDFKSQNDVIDRNLRKSIVTDVNK